MKINDIAEKLGITQRTVRHWEDTFKINIKRNPSGQRIYSEDDIKIFQAIKSLRDNDNGLNTISKKLDLELMLSSRNDNENLTFNDEKIETAIKDSQDHIISVMKSELNSIIDMSERLSSISHYVGKLETLIEVEKEKNKLLTDSNNKDISGLQKDLEKIKLENLALKADLEKEKGKTWLQKLFSK